MEEEYGWFSCVSRQWSSWLRATRSCGNPTRAHLPLPRRLQNRRPGQGRRCSALCNSNKVRESLRSRAGPSACALRGITRQRGSSAKPESRVSALGRVEGTTVSCGEVRRERGAGGGTWCSVGEETFFWGAACAHVASDAHKQENLRLCAQMEGRPLFQKTNSD